MANTTEPLNPLQHPPSLNTTFGAVLIGTFIGLVLYGLTLHQAYRYWRIYQKDPPVLKILVTAVLILETFNTLLSTHICYYYLTTSFFEPSSLLYGNWSIDLLPFSSGLVILGSQGFFARRVILVGKKYIAVAAVAIVCLAGEFSCFTAATGKAFSLPTFALFASYTWLISAGFAMAVAADLLLTSVLIVSLHQSRSGIKRTDSMIDVMILYSINTGLVTGIFNILSVILSLTLPQQLTYAGCGIIATKLYATTLLAALNSRQSLVAQGTFTFGMTELARGAPDPRAFNMAPRPRGDRGSPSDSRTLQQDSIEEGVIDIKSTNLISESTSHLTDLEARG